MQAIKIENPEIESRFKEYSAQHQKTVKDLVSDALKVFLYLNKKDDELIYLKEDPMKHLQKINYDYDEDFWDELGLIKIEDRAKYINGLREESKL